MDTSGNQSEASATIHVEHHDGVIPEVDIISVTLNEDNDQMIIIGTAKDETELKSYSLIMKYPSSEEKLLAKGNEAVEREVLARIDTKELESGAYTLELEATDKSGNKNKCIMQIQYQKKTEESTTEEPTTEEPTTEEPTTEEPTTEEPATEEPTPEEPSSEEPEEEKPTEEKAKLELQIDQKQVGVGDTVAGIVYMENVNKDSLRVVAGNKQLELVGNRFSYTAEDAGEVVFTATATDSNKEKVTASASVKVYDFWSGLR